MRNFLKNGETQTFYYAIKRRPTVYLGMLVRHVPTSVIEGGHQVFNPLMPKLNPGSYQVSACPSQKKIKRSKIVSRYQHDAHAPADHGHIRFHRGVFQKPQNIFPSACGEKWVEIATV